MNNKQKGITEFRNELLSTYEKGTFSLPRVVLIETRSKCNGTCAFCPASALTDERSDELMSLEVFNKIIDDLAKINYSNRVSLFNNNAKSLFIDGNFGKSLKYVGFVKQFSVNLDQLMSAR